MTKLLSILILLCVSAVGVALSLVNTNLVIFNYYFQEVELPLSLLLVFAFILGVFLTLILLIPTLIKYRFFSSKKSKATLDNASEDLPLIKPVSSNEPDSINNSSTPQDVIAQPSLR